MNRTKDAVAESVEALEREVHELRGELDELRRQLATEVCTARIVVGDVEERHVIVEPGDLQVNGTADRVGIVHTAVCITAMPTWAEVNVIADDERPHRDARDGQWVTLLATRDDDFEPGGPSACVEINGGDVGVAGSRVLVRGDARVA